MVYEAVLVTTTARSRFVADDGNDVLASCGNVSTMSLSRCFIEWWSCASS